MRWRVRSNRSPETRGALNVNSTQQLADVLFGKLGLPTEGLKKTQAG